MICIAKRRSGEPCKRSAIVGGRVCFNHGGGAPQVRKAARERLAAMVDPALDVLLKAMKMRSKGQPQPLAVVAARDILDRAGYKATDKVVISGTGAGGAITIGVTPADKLKAELDAIHERITSGTTSATSSGPTQ